MKSNDSIDLHLILPIGQADLSTVAVLLGELNSPQSAILTLRLQYYQRQGVESMQTDNEGM